MAVESPSHLQGPCLASPRLPHRPQAWPWRPPIRRGRSWRSWPSVQPSVRRSSAGSVYGNYKDLRGPLGVATWEFGGTFPGFKCFFQTTTQGRWTGEQYSHFDTWFISGVQTGTWFWTPLPKLRETPWSCVPSPIALHHHPGTGGAGMPSIRWTHWISNENGILKKGACEKGGGINYSKWIQ